MTTVNHTPRLGLAGALTAAGLLIAACGQGNPATAGNEQAVVDNEAGTLNAPPSDALGGATGQTPDYGQPGGVPSEAYSAPGSQPAGSEMPPPPGSN